MKQVYFIAHLVAGALALFGALMPGQDVLAAVIGKEEVSGFVLDFNQNTVTLEQRPKGVRFKVPRSAFDESVDLRPGKEVKVQVDGLDIDILPTPAPIGERKSAKTKGPR